MELLKAIPPIDVIVGFILVGALVRGLFRGLIGELFSIGALATACIAVRYGAVPTAAFLVDWTGGVISVGFAPFIATALIGIGTVAGVVAVGRVLKKGASKAGLRWADRLGGGALGTAEGALVAGVLLFGAIWLLGRDHEMLAETRSLAAFDELQGAIGAQVEQSGLIGDVAAPPP